MEQNHLIVTGFMKGIMISNMATKTNIEREDEKMEKLNVLPNIKLGEINDDSKHITLLECITEGLQELNRMSNGDFNIPPWKPDKKKIAEEPISTRSTHRIFQKRN